RHHHHHRRREDKDKESELEPGLKPKPGPEPGTEKSTQDTLTQIAKAAADLARNTNLTAQQQQQQQILPPKGRRAPMTIRDDPANRIGKIHFRRLVKGSGEIIERIVTQDQHRAINQLATRGDGTSYQAGLTQRLARR
ncbi:hypothetical protein BC937DRAFT_94890, partial [Endogone sp. FLAS-F59071]